jgi:poly [ADP-ribose] polymerase
MALKEDSDIELEIEGDDLVTGSKTLLKDIRQKGGETGTNLKPTLDDIDSKFVDWEPQFPYSCKLTREDIGASEDKPLIKTYQIQILKNKDGVYGLFCKWNSGGDNQDYSMNKTESFDEAVGYFKERFYEKTFNNWDDRETFKLVPGGYRWLGNFKVAKEAMDDEINPEKSRLRDQVRVMMLSANSTPCKLPRELYQALLILFNLTDSEAILDEFSINKHRLGLFDIEMKNLLRAFKTLSDVELQILSSSRRTQKIFEISTEFSFLIPQQHKIAQNPMIDDQTKLKRANQMVQLLCGIYYQVSLVKTAVLLNGLNNPIEDMYSALGTQLRSVPESDSLVYNEVSQLLTCHGGTHREMKLTLKDVFEINKESFTQSFYPFKRLKRRMLWVGAPAPKIVEYLFKGMTIVKTESPSSAYFFGKALYFTDVASKAAKHCGIEVSRREGFLLLCEVATGNEYSSQKPTVFKQAPTHYHSIKGQGKFEAVQHTDFNGAKGSVGIPEKVASAQESAFMFNEFAVFDEGQVRPAFLVKVEFNY